MNKYYQQLEFGDAHFDWGINRLMQRLATEGLALLENDKWQNHNPWTQNENT